MASKPIKGLENLKLVRDDVAGLKAAMSMLSAKEILVGFPEETTARDDEDSNPDITNAGLGYTHDNGMPEENIPARPFMLPGMENAIPQATQALANTAKQVLTKRSAQQVEMGLTRVGLAVQFALRSKINEGIPPPLSERTLRERASRGVKGRKGASKELQRRLAGEQPSTQFAKPLIDTGQLRNAINYVIRDRKNRSA